ncbi:hypothetical protein Tco_1495533 [Tanacetum coccineum]
MKRLILRPDRHVSETTERVIIETESIPTAATHPNNGKSIAQEETHMPDPPLQGVGADGAGSSLPPSLFVPDWFSLARGAMAQAHALSQFESLYDTHHALQLREEHAQCSEGLAVVQAEKDSLMATNAEQTLRIKELEQKLKSVDEVHSSAVKEDLESQLAQKDSALVYAERIPGLAEGRSEQELHKIMMRMNGFDPYSDKKMTAEYERLFSKTYPYVDRISHLSEKPVQDLLKLHPAPAPRDAPKAGSRGIAFSPKLVRAAEVASSKDTASKEFSRSKTGPSPQDPASTHASGGSKAPPSKKT